MLTQKRNIRETLELFDLLSNDGSTNQKLLAERVGIAVGLVNALLRRAVNKGYIKMMQAPMRRYAYYVTPKGFAEKSRLIAEYLRSSLDFFRHARAEYVELFRHAEACGHRRIALVGAGELAEIAFLSSAETSTQLLAVIDSKTNREQLCGLKIVRHLDDLEGCDALVLTDVVAPQATYAALAMRLPPERILVPRLLRVDRRPNLPTDAGGDLKDTMQ